jgi:DNA-binding MarR family transcriptional regulator
MPAIPAPAPTTEMAARLRLSATRLARQLRQQSSAGLTPSQLSALASIDRHGPLPLGELAEHERVAPPTITKVINKLEADGLVVRQLDDDDRRFCRVATTPAGDAFLAETRQRRDAWLTVRLDALDDDGRARLAAALDVLETLAGSEREPDGSP